MTENSLTKIESQLYLEDSNKLLNIDCINYSKLLYKLPTSN